MGEKPADVCCALSGSDLGIFASACDREGEGDCDCVGMHAEGGSVFRDPSLRRCGQCFPDCL